MNGRQINSNPKSGNPTNADSARRFGALLRRIQDITAKVSYSNCQPWLKSKIRLLR